jgi:hypothetical protein
MMSQVPGQPQNPADQQHQMDLQQQAAEADAAATKKAQKESTGTFNKLKQLL